MSAPPAAAADNLARAVRTDMSFSLSSLEWRGGPDGPPALPCAARNTWKARSGNPIQHDSGARIVIFRVVGGPRSRFVPFWNRSCGESERQIRDPGYFPVSNSPLCEPLGG